LFPSDRRLNSQIRVWRTTPLKELFAWETKSTNAISKLALPNEAYLSFFEDFTPKVFGLNNGRELSIPATFKGEAASLAFDPNGKYFGVAVENRLGLFEPSKGSILQPEIILQAPIQSLAFSPSAPSIIACLADSYVNPLPAEVIALQPGEKTPTHLWHRDGVLAADFRADGARLVTGSEDRSAIVWDMKRMKQVFPPLMHQEQVIAVTYSPNSQWIGTICRDDTVRIWDSETGNPVTPALGTPSRQVRLIFPPGNRSFITVESPKRFWIWDLPRAKRSAKTLLALSSLLNSSIQTDEKPGTDLIAETWRLLRQDNPEDFRVAKSDSVAWHKREAQRASESKLGWAAQFHTNFAASLGAGSSDAGDGQDTVR
jgi:WD40 repeat protein